MAEITEGYVASRYHESKSSSCNENCNNLPMTSTIPGQWTTICLQHPPHSERQSLDHTDLLEIPPKLRISRTKSLNSRTAYDQVFTHPASSNKTSLVNLVDFDGPDDPYLPINWPFRKKCVTTVLYGLTTMGATLASTIYSPETTTVAREYEVPEEVSILGTSLVLAGFGIGPLIFGPVSEIWGRKPAILLPYLIGIFFAFACGASRDIQSILITRFFLGLFCSGPVVNTGGVLADIWAPTHRANALVFYALAVVGGPLFGPIIGGAFIISDVDWRWTQFLSGLFMLMVWILDILVLDESYPPALLVHKARRLRFKTHNWALHARHEEWDPTPREFVTKFGVRPLRMLINPVCFSVALYASFCYGVLYGNLASFPIIFEQEHGLNALIGALPFLGLFVGVLLASCINMMNQKQYIKAYKAANERAVPEARLPPMMLGGFLFAGGCFVIGWTSSPNLPIAGPLLGTVLLGMGFFTVFQAALNYLIDTFGSYSASAIAANTFLRSAFAFAFPLFVGPMYARLGVGWGTSVFGLFATALIPVPFLFYHYGAAMRRHSNFMMKMES